MYACVQRTYHTQGYDSYIMWIRYALQTCYIVDYVNSDSVPIFYITVNLPQINVDV